MADVLTSCAQTLGRRRRYAGRHGAEHRNHVCQSHQRPARFRYQPAGKSIGRSEAKPQQFAHDHAHAHGRLVWNVPNDDNGVATAHFDLGIIGSDG